jgi:aspartyl-tRNA(Asn)/glutamyl-tRNA(Gln) amidotransferase subunit C
MSDIDMKKILWLSRLTATPQEQESLAKSLENILGWVSMMEEVDVSDAKPIVGVIDQMPRRDDVVTDGGIVDQILQNAPDKAFGMFGVPKVVE